MVPAYNASETIRTTLCSVLDHGAPQGWTLEVLVVDDGSKDSAALREVLQAFPSVRLLSHERNRGMCAARNTGILASTGDVVTILDADDSFVARWPEVFTKIWDEWPVDCQLCYSVCHNHEGRPTVSEPTYRGRLTQEDLLNQRHTGEYLPMFRGAFLRGCAGYIDLKMRRSCGLLSYLSFAEKTDFWVTPSVLRIYDDARGGAVSRSRFSREKSEELARCFGEVLRRFGDTYKQRAPRVYRTMWLRYAVYLRMAGQEKAWDAWSKGARVSVAREAVVAAGMLVLGPRFTDWAVERARTLGLIKRYG